MRKLTTSYFIQGATEKHNGFYDYSNSIYDGANKKIIIICPKHGEFKQIADNHLRLGHGCPKCCYTSQLEFVEEATQKHNGVYDYSKSVYTKLNGNIIIICPKHGEFKQRASAHLDGAGCRKCCWASQHRTQQEFLEEATRKHNGAYDYSKSVYEAAHKEITIICPKHGEFKQEANSHLRGTGCSKCADIRTKNITTKTISVFIEEATKKHNGYYDYSKSVYSTARKKIIIICPEHGEFRQAPSMHLDGRGCPECGVKNRRYTISDFIEMATKKHDVVYDYSKSIYDGSNKKIIIICPKHGEFTQKAITHLSGHGCPKCCHVVSKPETMWLDSLSVPIEFRQQTIRIDGRRFRTDAADINKKIVWEFYGDFFHGNLRRFNSKEINKLTKHTFGELNSKTIERENAMKDAGYTVISIWESDFKNIPQP